MLTLYLVICFFFSSRRRHTRSYGDWSSDVCSSDLTHNYSRNSANVHGFPSLVALEIRFDHGRCQANDPLTVCCIHAKAMPIQDEWVVSCWFVPNKRHIGY